MTPSVKLDQSGRAVRMSMLMKGVAQDVRTYRALLLLLEEQFDAALHCRTAPLADLAGQIVTAVDALELQRQKRVALVEELIGAGGTMQDTLALVTGNTRALLESGWQLLEELVQDCKQRNTRNCQLIMDQQAIMQRVLNGEDEIYAPG